MAEQIKVSEREYEQAGHKKKSQQPAPSDGGQQQHSQNNSSAQPSHFLPKLHVLAARLDGRIERFLLFPIVAEQFEDLLTFDDGLFRLGLGPGESVQLPVQLRETVRQNRELGFQVKLPGFGRRRVLHAFAQSTLVD